MTTLVNPDAVTAFWKAVAASSPTLLRDAQAAAKRGRSTDEFESLHRVLRGVHPGLTITMGGNPRRPEFIISSDGDKRLFPIALAVVDAAPVAVKSRFDVRNLRPRSHDPAGMALTIKGRTVTATDILWTATPQLRNPAVCDIDLFIPGWIEALPLSSIANEKTGTAVFTLLDHLLGEYTVETQVGAIEWHSTERIPPDAKPLLALPAHLDSLAAQ